MGGSVGWVGGGGVGRVPRPDGVGVGIARVREGRRSSAVAARGKPISQARIRAIAQGPGVAILCGRFEGFDERIFEAYPQIEQVSLADIVLSGGETAALAILDACIRLPPGVTGAPASGVEDSYEQGPTQT